MNEHSIALTQAKNAVKIADHMLNVTYDIVNDPKLLMVIAERLLLAQEQVSKAVLSYNVTYSTIPSFKQEFEELFSKMKKVIEHHKQSPVEFSRKEEYVICSENYDTDILTKSFLKESIITTKVFIENIETMLTKQQSKEEQEINSNRI